MPTTHTPPLQAPQFTPHNAPSRRRAQHNNPPRPSLSQSFSLNPGDPSNLSDVSLIGTPTRGRVAHLTSVEQGNMGMSGQVSPRVRSPLKRTAAIAGPSSSFIPDSEPRATRSRSRLSEVTGPGDEDEEMDEEERWSMVDSMRLWRNDALLHHLYETAALWGDKILEWTGDSNDAFWLAQTYFHMQHYVRAERLLTEPLRPRHTVKDKGKGRDLGSGDEDEDEEESESGPRPRLIGKSLACRALATQCLMYQGKYHEALEMVGKTNPFREPGAAARPASDEGIKLNSSMCYLRGMLHLRLSSLPQAKECFIEALVIDVKNYEAFRELVEKQMMTATEEWEFVNNLAYRSQLAEDEAEFVRLMYLSKLRKDAHVAEIAAVRKALSEKYALSDNCDVLVGLAEELFAAYKWEDCYAVTSKILKRVPGHQGALQLHLACMHHVPRLHSSLFMLAHDLVEAEPDEATTWYAVGLWYYSGQRWADARRYFSKANLIDQRFGPAWITYAHSFRQEGEHDQAITAYSTAARSFPGSHLTYLFIGMEHLQLSQCALAEEYLLTAAAIHPTDPLLLNELGVAAYNRDDFPTAIDYLERAIAGAGGMQGQNAAWSASHCNLGHALRITGRYAEAKAAYASALKLDPTNGTAYASQGMISQLEGDVRTAIRQYHIALSITPQDPVATVLLEMALAEQVSTLEPHTILGLPVAIASVDLDPFAVPKGNPLFGPLPVDRDPATLEEAGEGDLVSPPRATAGEPSTLSMSMSMSMVTTRRTYPDESSAMDIEED